MVVQVKFLISMVVHVWFMCGSCACLFMSMVVRVRGISWSWWFMSSFFYWWFMSMFLHDHGGLIHVVTLMMPGPQKLVEKIFEPVLVFRFGKGGLVGGRVHLLQVPL